MGDVRLRLLPPEKDVLVAALLFPLAPSLQHVWLFFTTGRPFAGSSAPAQQGHGKALIIKAFPTCVLLTRND
jgi:hypothetical protein